jgi:drug/metabolite transporter (DMT)-like permease
MSAYRYFMVLMCVVLISVGQVLFKYAALNSNRQQGLMGLVLNKYLIVAGVVYVAATLLWVWQLKFVPLNRAYPVFAAAFIIVPCFSWLLFRERVTLPYVLGVALIICGVALCGRNMT